LREEDGDLVLVDGEEERGRGLAAEVGEVGAFQGGVGGQAGGVGEVEAEGIRLWNQGLTMWRSVEMTCGVAVLDRAARCWSRSSAARVLVWWSSRQPRSETASTMAAASAAQTAKRMKWMHALGLG
jgi:hypothetical protein